ncbi:MAG: radical SAM protein [Clostridia bacterium]|nr:radical SAM protein [Clostridia bacterium]
MLEINNNVVLVKGAKNGAIYNFNNSQVYAIDSEVCSTIYNVLIEGKQPNSDTEEQHLRVLTENGLISPSFKCRPYEIKKPQQLNLNFAWLELTGGCNLKCLHCYEGNEHKVECNALTVQDWKRILSQLKEAGCKKIQLTGGEPCLFWGFEEVLIYAHHLGFEEICVFTNASLLTEHLIKLLHDLKISVRFSLYGHCASVHDAITQTDGSFEKTVSNVKKMAALNIDLLPSVIIMKENEQYVKEIKEFIESLKLEYEGFDVIRQAGCGNQSEHLPTIREILYSKHKLYAHFKASKEFFDKAAHENTCWYGKLAIDSLGNVFPCVFQRDVLYGNASTHSIKEILSSPELKKGWLCDFSKIEVCKDCEFRFACKDCRAHEIAITGNFFGKNPRCLYNPYLGKWGSPFKL